ncbi:MAG: ATP-NAD kinase family protein [Candidatus Lokiarchaeota archaeon]|nr:ATP-NAD kinase family protein [Candidatus Harpocratesius repetitus]
MISQKRKKIGFVLNPIAGLGGKLGLKGSDGEKVIQQAQLHHEQIQSPQRAKEFLKYLKSIKDEIYFLTVEGIMGGNILEQTDFSYELLNDAQLKSTKLYHTSATHTQIAARHFKDLQVDLLVFIGGDGTARDVCEIIGMDIPCLGIPGGVKIHSSVFAIKPEMAAKLVIKYLHNQIPLREAEVLDIDEEEFRNNRVVSKLYGYLRVPYEPTLSQPSKMASPHTEEEFANQDRIAEWIIMEWENSYSDWYYLLGPGTTVRAISKILGEPKTLLGVDLFYHKKLIASDLNEEELLAQIKDRPVKLIVTPIGAQGFVFGRGNLQLSAKVLEAIGIKNIQIIATKFKISTLPQGKLRIDSRNSEFDKKFQGLHRVLVDFGEYNIIKVE